ncbi:MAG: metal-dependent hydrolase [Gemmatimonadota bacterium]|nr:metal-dependent hydrolase [Gemmatimonadota bacterium]MDE3128850.1 metal-dependent hydrolase [Gemmatimonadota bacterium]MDE3172750.1 metal-dependent hydrolase [Gemmatimonadota bacterium]MDE3215978.1 metal-dependent hydrolase [Gemmatimonadota bacterium]
MIVGHLGLALGARAVDRDAPLPWLVAAAVAPDVLDLGLAAGGVCNVGGEYTHSLAAIAITALVLGTAGGWATRSGKTGLLVAALVVSHLLADYVTGIKALWIGGPMVGLDLYRWPWADFLIEAPIVVAAWWAARRRGDRPRWVASRFVLVALLAGQLAADVAMLGGDTENRSVCAKADLVDQAQKLF